MLVTMCWRHNSEYSASSSDGTITRGITGPELLTNFIQQLDLLLGSQLAEIRCANLGLK